MNSDQTWHGLGSNDLCAARTSKNAQGQALAYQLEESASHQNQLEVALASHFLIAADDHPNTLLFGRGEVLAKRYVVDKLIARGGMGEVYKGYDLRSNRPLAIKAIVSTLADDPRAIGRLHREAQLASRIHHKNVCHVYGLGVHNENPRDTVHFITMSYLGGQSLKQALRHEPMTIAQSLSIALQLLRGLSAIHQAGVLHRDLKSDNIVLAGKGTGQHATIIDFGLACKLNASNRVVRASMSGSLGYMAPEQLRGEELSPRTDLFSFGVVLFEMLSGTMPFAHSSPLETLKGPESFVAPRLRSLLSKVPRKLDELVHRCLSYHPSERHSNALCTAQAIADIWTTNGSKYGRL